MAQNSTYNIPNTVGATFRSNINSALGDVVTTNSGALAPTGVEVNIGMLWYNTDGATVSGIPGGTVGVCTAVANQGTETGVGTWTPVGTEGAITEAQFTTVFGSSKDLGDITSTYTASTDTLDLTIESNAVDVDELNATAPTAGQILTASSATEFSWADPAGGGVPHFGSWFLSSNDDTHDTGSTNVIRSNWSEQTALRQGTAITVTDQGYFRFPELGVWYVSANAFLGGISGTGSDIDHRFTLTHGNLADSSTTSGVGQPIADGYIGTTVGTDGLKFGIGFSSLFNVTSLTNYGIQLRLVNSNGSWATIGAGDGTGTKLTFIKLV